MTTNNKMEKKQYGDVEQTADRPVFVPATDIYEQDKRVLIQCDMPGVDDKSIEVTLEDNVLSLTGTQTTNRPAGYDALLNEYEVGVYHREFSIPQEIDRDAIKARIRNGVLQVELPKAEQAQPKQIPVEAGK